MSRYGLIVLAFMAFFAAVEAAFGLYRKPGVLTMREVGASLLSLAANLFVRGVVSLALTSALGAFWPGSRGALAGASPWLVAPIYFLLSDYGFYFVHRKSHEVPWLWWIHKPHHTAQNLNVAVTYRENWIWALVMTDTWLPPILAWLGQPAAYVAAAAVRTVISLVVHSELRWDLPLQRNRFTRPLMWVIERIVTLPDTHHVHHGVGRHGNAMKNYGSALAVFDLLHGTLAIPHARQEAFGLPEGAPVEPWTEQLFWPFVRSKKKAAGARRPLGEATPAAALAAAQAVIYTADGRAVVVS
jgi:sterol desaturase/sphingolipid hydroxylase (fatty acid hydroxylase superfamily)